MTLTLPNMPSADEDIFYVIEGATLQLFGEESYPVFMFTMRAHPLHSLSYTSVSDFTRFAIEEEANAQDSPTPEWDEDMRLGAMLQCLYVRRCLFAPIHEMLSDNCHPHMLEGAIKEHQEAGVEAVYREGIQKMLKARYKELLTDTQFQAHLESTEATHQLQIENMHKLFHLCEDYAETLQINFVASMTRSTEARCAYLVRQFSFATTILRDYFTRDLARQGANVINRGDCARFRRGYRP